MILPHPQNCIAYYLWLLEKSNQKTVQFQKEIEQLKCKFNSPKFGIIRGGKWNETIRKGGKR